MEKHAPYKPCLPLKMTPYGLNKMEVQDAQGQVIGIIHQYEKAAFIVTACNHFEELVGALRGFVNYYNGSKRAHLGNGYAYKFWDEARALLAKVGKE